GEQRAVAVPEPEDRRQLAEAGRARAELGHDVVQEVGHGQEAVLADERGPLVYKGQERHQVDEAEQPQRQEAREPVPRRAGIVARDPLREAPEGGEALQPLLLRGHDVRRYMLACPEVSALLVLLMGRLLVLADDEPAADNLILFLAPALAQDGGGL